MVLRRRYDDRGPCEARGGPSTSIDNNRAARRIGGKRLHFKTCVASPHLDGRAGRR